MIPQTASSLHFMSKDSPSRTLKLTHVNTSVVCLERLASVRAEVAGASVSTAICSPHAATKREPEP